MKKALTYGLSILAAWSIAFSTQAQVEVVEDMIPEKEIQLFRQYSVFGQIHSNGFGLGARFGRRQTISKYNFQEFEFLKLKHPKAEKLAGLNLVKFSRRYIYGGINQLYTIRYGYGTQRTLNHKPYWGGLQVDYNLVGGVVLGLAIPQYLNIIYIRDSTFLPSERLYVEAERFDANNPLHNDWGYIDGQGPLFKGLWHLRPYPGIYGKFGFNFDFGKYQERVLALEVGLMVDIFPFPVPMMAHLKPNYVFTNFYLAFHFGQRFNGQRMIPDPNKNKPQKTRERKNREKKENRENVDGALEP